MMDSLPPFLQAVSGYEALLAMWGALALHWFFPVPRHANIFTYWQQIAIALAAKVNHPADPPFQQRLSGTLSVSLMWLTMLVLLVAFHQLVWLPWLFDLVLLWFALGLRPVHQLGRSLASSLAIEDKQTALLVLSRHVNRETGNLSLSGLGKAGCETLLLGYFRQVIAVLFWYALAGGIGALLYSLAMTLARCWSPSREKYRYFGIASARLLVVADWFPVRLFALLIAAGQGYRLSLRAISNQGQRWPLPGSGWLLAATGTKFRLALGGPAIYNGRKQARARIGGEIAPSAIHLSQIQHELMVKTAIWITLQSALMWLAK